MNLIYGYFDILLSQYCQVKKNCVFQGFAKIVLWLHTAGTENPDTTQTHPSASNFHEYHSNTPRHLPKHPPDTTQTYPINTRCQKMTTGANRHKQTVADTPRHWQVLFEWVWQCLLAYVVVCWLLVFPGDVWGVSGGCLGDVWGVSGGIRMVIMNIGGSWMGLWGIWVVSPCSMEPQRYFGKTLKDTIFLHLTVLRQQNIKMSIYKVDKNGWVIWLFKFLVPVREK